MGRSDPTPVEPGRVRLRVPLPRIRRRRAPSRPVRPVERERFPATEAGFLAAAFRGRDADRRR